MDGGLEGDGPQNKATVGEMAMNEVELRAPRPGDLSWLQHRHMQVMIPAYGWDQRYEAHVAHIVGDFLMAHDPARERFWVADSAGEILGCVGLTRESDARARLRLLFVEPEARGMGLGRRLTETCIAFAREQGYAEVVLWTVSVLEAARKIYADVGFKMIGAQTSDLSASMCDETWLLKL